MPYDVITFGEAMLRLSPPNFLRLEQAQNLDVRVGGAELNTAVGLARLGRSSAWVSRLPANSLGRLVANRAREAGVSTEYVVWSDGEPLNADDVTFTLDVLYDPNIDTPAREGLMIDTPAPDGTIKRQPFRYRKLDERTVEFRLPCRYAPAINTFIFSIAPRHKLEAAYRSGKFNTTWGANTPPSVSPPGRWPTGTWFAYE